MTTSTAPQAFAVSPDGVVLASIDGAEVLVWTSERGEPLWKAVGDALYIDVDVSSNGVFLIDASGVFEHRRISDGSLEHRFRLLGSTPVCVRAHREHVVACDATTLVWVIRGTPTMRAELPGVVAVDIGNNLVGAVDAGGSLSVFHLDEATTIGRIAVGGPPTDLSWHPGGYWVVAVARRLVPISHDASAVHVAVGLGETDVQSMVFGVNGSVAVVNAEPRQVGMFAWPSGEPLGNLRIGRDIIGFGPGRRGALWLGLRHGDVQGFDLMSGQIDAAAPHEGRARVPWGVDARVEVARVRGLHASKQAGGLPLAIWVAREDDDGPPRWVILIAKALGILFVVSIVAGLFWVLAVYMNWV